VEAKHQKMNVKKLTRFSVKFSNSGGERFLQCDKHNRQTRASEQQCKAHSKPLPWKQQSLWNVSKRFPHVHVINAAL